MATAKNTVPTDDSSEARFAARPEVHMADCGALAARMALKEWCS
ncbi:hypothetical protein [Roseateles sp. P5_E11]